MQKSRKTRIKENQTIEKREILKSRMMKKLNGNNEMQKNQNEEK